MKRGKLITIILGVAALAAIATVSACIYKDEERPVGDKYHLVSGTVSDSGTGVPLLDVAVVYADTVAGEPWSRSRTTDAAGYYVTRVGRLPIGFPVAGALSFSKEGYRQVVVLGSTLFPNPEVERRTYDVRLSPRP